MKHGPAATERVGPVQKQHVQVGVEVKCRAKARATAFQARFFP
jgi:hypothetical protein